MDYKLVLTGIKDNDCRDEVVNALIGAARLGAAEAYYAIDNPPYVISNRDTLEEAKELKDNIERSGAIIEIEESERTYLVRVIAYDYSKKANVIKGIHEALDVDFRKAIDIVDGVPVVVATGLTKEEAEKIVDKLNGAQVTSKIERE